MSRGRKASAAIEAHSEMKATKTVRRAGSFGNRKTSEENLKAERFEMVDTKHGAGHLIGKMHDRIFKDGTRIPYTNDEVMVFVFAKYATEPIRGCGRPFIVPRAELLPFDAVECAKRQKRDIEPIITPAETQPEAP